jgi:hypothetical protein
LLSLNLIRGVSVGIYTFQTFSHTRASLSVPHFLESGLACRYPPYNEDKLAFLRLLVNGFLPSRARSKPVGTIGDPSAMRAHTKFRSVPGIILRNLTKNVSIRLIFATTVVLAAARALNWKWVVAGLMGLFSFGRDKKN